MEKIIKAGIMLSHLTNHTRLAQARTENLVNWQTVSA